jgi:hypothetical protein
MQRKKTSSVDRRTFLITSSASVLPLAMMGPSAAQAPSPSPTPETIPVNECERRRRSRETRHWAQYGRALVDAFGSEVLAVLEATTNKRVADWLRNRDLAKRNLDTLESLLWDQLGEEFEYTQIERTPETMKYSVTRCPYAIDMRKRDAGDIGYALYCAGDYGYCEGLNPKIRFTRSKTLMQGDDCCDHAYELKADEA